MRPLPSRPVVRLLLLAVMAGAVASHGPAAEPYAFKSRPRDPEKTVWLEVDFEGSLPEKAELGANAKVEEKVGTKGSKALVSTGKGLIARFPIPKTNVDVSRFDLSVDYAGPGFSYFTAKLVAFDRAGKQLRAVTVGGEWGIATGTRTWELRTVNLEFNDIHAVALEFEQTNDDGTVKLDNIVLRRHELPSFLGRTARKDLEIALKQEGLKVADVSGVWIGTGPDRQSFFDFGNIDETKRFVRSDWQERLHIGTTYNKWNGTLPTFMLGVSAREAALEAAAARQKKTLADMHKLLLDDVKEHGFNLVWCDFTKELESFDALAAARGISVIIRDPQYSQLEKWIAKPDGPIPDDFKKAAQANLAKYAKMKSLVGYQVNRPLAKQYQPMLAEARKHLASVAPNVQLVDVESDVFSAESIQEPYPNLGIQFGGFHHYAGRPWIPPSYLYHPNYWPIALSEGWYRRIHNGFTVCTVPNLWTVPSGRQFGKKSIAMQSDQVKADVTGWTFDDTAKKWSGWYRYQFPENMMRSVVWTAVEAGTAGVIVEEWGPAEIPATVTGPEILADAKYKDGNYQPDTLRRFDLSESEVWKELGAAARAVAPLKLVFETSTLHGNNAARTNRGDVKVRTLTGRSDPFKLLAVVNTRVGEYDQTKLTIDPKDGTLQEYTSAGPLTVSLIVENDTGLIDLTTGRNLTPKSTDAKKRETTYDIELGPGEGKLFFRGKLNLYARFAQKYKIPTTGTASVSASPTETAR